MGDTAAPARMRRALRLAAAGPWPDPNPRVGCVIVGPDGAVVGEGFHHGAGTPHAEIEALREAADAARGATAYVTLEPCSHTGRTGPCSDALADAGVSRVVFAQSDPNPDAAGGAERCTPQACTSPEASSPTRPRRSTSAGLAPWTSAAPW